MHRTRVTNERKNKENFFFYKIIKKKKKFVYFYKQIKIKGEGVCARSVSHLFYNAVGVSVFKAFEHLGWGGGGGKKGVA